MKLISLGSLNFSLAVEDSVWFLLGTMLDYLPIVCYMPETDVCACLNLETLSKILHNIEKIWL